MPDEYITKEEIKPLEDVIRTLNREMGEVVGELKGLRDMVARNFKLILWFVGGSMLVIVGGVIKIAFFS